MLLELAKPKVVDDLRLKQYDTGIEGFVRFCDEVMGKRVWSKQIEFAASVLQNRRTGVRSGHSTGKTEGLALVCEYWFSVRGRCFYTTAPGLDAVKDGLWRALRANREAARRPDLLPGEITATPALTVPGHSRWWGRGFATNKSERAQGRHEEGLLIVADEAAGLEDFIWEALESSMASEDVRMVAVGNPNSKRNKFRAIFHELSANWNCLHISSYDSPNVTKKEAPVPGLATPEWIEEQKVNYKNEPGTFKNRVLGEFTDFDADTKVLPITWIVAAQKLWLELEEEEQYYSEPPRLHAAFLDVSGWGKDTSVLSVLAGQRLQIVLEGKDKSDEGLMRLAEAADAWVRSLPDDNKPSHLAVDCDAVGAGVFSRLCQLHRAGPDGWGRCRPVKFHWGWGASPDKKDKFVDLIDELHWDLRDVLDPSKPRHERIAVPPGEEVIKHLNMRGYYEDKREKKKVENKDSLKKRNQPSPDICDSFVGCMYKPRLVKVAVG